MTNCVFSIQTKKNSYSYCLCILGITDAIDFVQDTLTELSTDREIIDKPYNILYSGLSTISMSSSMSPPTYTYVFHEHSTNKPTGKRRTKIDSNCGLSGLFYGAIVITKWS